MRKHLSAIKGGRLAATAWPAPVLTLAISDETGDDSAVIDSGPTVADPTTAVDALTVLVATVALFFQYTRIGRALRAVADEAGHANAGLEAGEDHLVQADRDEAGQRDVERGMVKERDAEQREGK